MKKSPFLNDNEERWSVIILRRELAQLQREQEHLRLKNLERALTPWERLRMAECMDEMMDLLSQFSKSRFQMHQSQQPAESFGDGDFDAAQDDESLQLSIRE